MSGVFAAATAALFADPNLSAAASLRRPSRADLAVRVIRRDTVAEGETGVSNTRRTGATFEMLQSACPVQPENGTLLLVGGETWSVIEVEVHERRGTWVMACQRA